jgi:CTP:molybdopterin cytidylyltransferase MocA
MAVVREPVARQLAPAVAGLAGNAELLVSAAEPWLGPAGSIAAFVAQAGELGPEDLVAISPVDVLPEAWSALPALAKALDATGGALGARPVHRGRGGHPVVVRLVVLKVYGKQTPPMPLRDVLRALGSAVLDVEIPSEAVTTDLDTPADFARFAPPG